MKKDNEFKMVVLDKKYYSFLSNNSFNSQIMMKETRPFLFFSKDNIFGLELFYIIPFTSRDKKHEFDIEIPNCKKSKKIRISKSIPILNDAGFIKDINPDNLDKKYEDTYKKFKLFLTNKNFKKIEKNFNNFLIWNIENFYEPSNNSNFYPTNILRLNSQLYIYKKEKKANSELEKIILAKFWFYINEFNNKNEIKNEDFELKVNKNKIIFKNNLDSQNYITINLKNKNWKLNIFWWNEFCQYLTKNQNSNKKFLKKYSYPFSQDNKNWSDILELQNLLKQIKKSKANYNFMPKIKNKIIQISLNYLNSEENFKLLEKWVSNKFLKITDDEFNLLKVIWEIEKIKISSINSFKDNFLGLSDKLIQILLCKIKFKQNDLIKEFNKNISNIFIELNKNTLKEHLKKYDPGWILPDFIEEIIMLLEFEKIIGKNEIENFNKFSKFIDFLKDKIIFYKNLFENNPNWFHSKHHQKILKLESRLSNEIKNLDNFKKMSIEYKFLLQIKQLSKFNEKNLKFKVININNDTAKILLDILEEIKKELCCQLTNLHIDLNSWDEINDSFIYFSKTKNKIFLDKNLSKLEQLLILEKQISVNEQLTRNISNNQDYKKFLISKSTNYLKRYNININSKNIRNQIKKILRIIQKN